MSVFIQPEKAAAAAATESSSNGIIPRHVIVKNLIKHHHDRIEEIDNETGSLIDQLLNNRKAREEHKLLSYELLHEQEQ
ncbi:MAG: hypothetical protein ACKPKO_40530, partial [Candidatus Fonsibacter sp.]